MYLQRMSKLLLQQEVRPCFYRNFMDYFTVSPWPQVPACEDRPRNLGGFEARARCAWYMMKPSGYGAVRYQIFADRNEDMHCTNINWDMTLVDSNVYAFLSPGIPMTNQTWFSMISLMWMILHSLICCGGVSCQCKTIANKHGKGFEEQGSSKENMLEKIAESRKTSLKIAGRPEEVYTAAWRFIWGERCPAGSRGLFKQRGDAVWMVRGCESLSPRWRIHHVER